MTISVYLSTGVVGRKRALLSSRTRIRIRRPKGSLAVAQAPLLVIDEPRCMNTYDCR